MSFLIVSIDRDNDLAAICKLFIGVLAKSTAVTEKPFLLKDIASYPLPHP